MGWYVKTVEQLLDTGWRKDDTGYTLERGSIYFASPMKSFCGKPFFGKYPEEDEYTDWIGWMWTREMLTWFPE